jgi:hypothetical protein
MEEDNPDVSREELYRQVWAEPISKLAGTYNVSGSCLARICRELNIPTPGRGYWAQLKAEKNPAQADLPPLRVGDPARWIRSVTSSLYTDVLPVPPEAHSEIPPRRRSRPPHEFLIDAKEIFPKAKTSYSSVFLAPRHQKLVDLVTSREHLDDSLALAQKLFSRLEDYGYRVLLANGESTFRKPQIETKENPETTKNTDYVYNPWRPGPSTVTYLGTVAIGLAIVEMTELAKTNGYHSYMKTVASGRYRIYAYSPYRYTQLVKSWQDTKDFKLERRMALEARRECEAESRADLEELIASWASLKNQHEFLDELIHALDEVEPEIRNELFARLNAAKALLGTASVVDLIRTWKTPKEKYASLPHWRQYDED